MKLLVTTGDLRDFLTPNFHNLLEEIGRRVELYVWYEAGDIREIIKHLNIAPDFVLVNEYGETNAPAITGLSALDIPYAAALHDLHYRPLQRQEALDRDNIRFIFSLYRDKFYEWYPRFWNRLLWLPHHFDPRIFHDYGLAKDIDCLLMGAIHPTVYPLRHKILQAMQSRPGFVYHSHPGYRNFDINDEALVGERFAREINRAKIFFTCDSAYKYPVAKYYEVLACRTLLLASPSKELYDLGFEPDVNYVAINGHNFAQKTEYYLKHEEEREEIVSRGYALVHTRHTTAIRAMQMLAMIERIIQQGRREPAEQRESQ